MSGYGGARIHICGYLTILLFNGGFDGVYGGFASMSMEVFYSYGEYFHLYSEIIFIRMEFPEFGMICPVQGCPASSLYRKLDQLN